MDDLTASAAWEAVVQEFAAVDAALSNFREDSAVSAMNRRPSGSPAEPVDPRLYTALSLSDRAWRITRGRFDPRVAVALQRLGRPGPIPVSITPADPCGTNGRWLQRDGRSRAVATNEPLDLGGIGKGLALRWAWRRVSAILQDKASGGLLECGGDLVGRGPGPDGAAWLIGIEDPRVVARPPGDGSDTAAAPAPIAVVALGEGAICTSSTRLGRWRAADGRQIHHLIDPLTQQPGGDGLLSVTVAWPDPAWAEVRTKELFLSGRNIAVEARRRDVAAWWVTSDGGLEMTARAREVTPWT